MRGFWVRAWSEDQDVHTAEDMSAVAGRAGMDQRTIGECLEAARSQEVKQRLKEVTAEAVDRGAFGSPTMFFSEGEADTEHMFWGSDRSGDGTVITLLISAVVRFEMVAAVYGKPWLGPDPGTTRPRYYRGETGGGP